MHTNEAQVRTEDSEAQHRAAGQSRRPFSLDGLLGRSTDAVYTALRVVAGLLFAFHGLQVLFGLFMPFRPAFGTQVWLGGVIELAAGVAIAAGAATIWAAFLASGTMAVAYIQFHWRFHLGAQFLPAVNQGEPALLYSFLFLFVACRGGGRFSLDAWAARSRARTPLVHGAAAALS